MLFVNDPIDVEVRISAEGELCPLAFSWRRQRYPVISVGRTYTQDDDRYILVMTPGDRIFELRWHIPDNRWFVSRAPQQFTVA